MSAHREPDMVAEYAKNARMRGLRVIIAGAGLSAALPGRRRRAHRPAGDRRAAVVPPVGRRAASTRSCRSCRCRRACRSRASAWTTRATPRSSPRRSSAPERDRPLHPPRELGASVDRRGAHGALARASRSPPARSCRAARRARARRERARGDPRGDVHGRGGQRARARHRPRRGRVRRRARRRRPARPGAGSTTA